MVRVLSGLFISVFIFFTFSSFHSGDHSSAIKLKTIVIDPVTPSPEASEVITRIRENPATQAMPVIALPTSRMPLAEAVQLSGATEILPRTINTPAELTDAIQLALASK